jgi:hypothetical protein
VSLGEVLLRSNTMKPVYPVTLAGCVASTLDVEAPVTLDEPALWVWFRELSALDVTLMDAQDRSALTADLWSSGMALGPLGVAQTVRVHPEYLRALTALMAHVLPSTPILLRAYDPSEEDHIAANRFLMGCVFGAGLAPTQAIILQGFRGTPPVVEAWLGLPATVNFSLGGSIVEFSEAEKNGVRRITHDRLLIESCPPLSPSGIEHPATPIHLGWVAHHVAQVLGQSDTFVSRITLVNGLSAFRMPVVRDHPM